MNPLIGKSFAMIVKHSALAASGGDYLVRYRAEITLTQDSDIQVVVESVYPNDPANDDVEVAKGEIKKGCTEVLGPRGIGARVVVNDLTIHPVDFKPQKFALWTALDLERRLAAMSV